MIALTFYGVINSYSPVPWSDLWDNQIFLLNKLIIEKDIENFLLTKAVDHPIFFTKLTFLLDYLLFGSSLILPLIINLISPLIILIIICKVNNKKIYGNNVLYFLLGFSYTWLQSQNFYWANQVQIWFNLVFSIFAIYFFSLSIIKDRLVDKLICVIFSLFTALTFANGLLIPLIFFFILIINKNFFHALFHLFIVISIYYFYQLNTASNIPDINLFFDYLNNFLILNGNVFFKLFNNSYLLTKIMSLIYLFFTFNYLVKNYLSKKIDIFYIFFIIFNLFYFGTLVLISVNRWHIDGFYLMVSNRYLTFTIFAWIILFFAYEHKLNRLLIKNIFQIFLFVITIHLLSLQFKVFSPGSKILNREAAILSLNLNIRDMDQIFNLTQHNLLFDEVGIYKKFNFAIFGHDNLVRIRNNKSIFNDSIYENAKKNTCDVNIVDFRKVDDIYYTIKGELIGSSKYDDYLMIINPQNNEILGYGVSRAAENIFRKYIKNNFIAYLKSDSLNGLNILSSKCIGMLNSVEVIKN